MLILDFALIIVRLLSLVLVPLSLYDAFIEGNFQRGTFLLLIYVSAQIGGSK